MTEDIDDLLRAAARAHEGLATPDYFDGLPDRVMARIARIARDAPTREPDDAEVPMMSDTDNDRPRAAAPPPGLDASSRPAERSEDSGLHDIKSLARSTKQRISRRITSQHDAYEESLLSSSQSGLRAVALPAPAQVVSLPELPAAAAAAAPSVATAGADVTPLASPRAGRSKTVWYVAAGAVLAAAAAAVVVLTSGGGSGSGDQVAAGSTARGGEAAVAAGVPADRARAAAPGAVAVSATTPTETGTVAIALPAEPSAPAADSAPAPSGGGGAATGGVGGAATGDVAGKTRGDRGDKLEERDGKAAPRGAGAGSATSATGATDKGAAGGKGKATTDDKPRAGAGGGGGATAGGGGGDQSIEELLSAASGGAQKPTQGGGDGGKPEKTGLDSKDIRTSMSAVAKKAQACFDQHGVAGLVKVKATVDPTGAVTKAEATGEFAGTPTGACVAAAAKSASFPTWTGAPMTVNYGFTLQE